MGKKNKSSAGPKGKLEFEFFFFFLIPVTQGVGRKGLNEVLSSLEKFSLRVHMHSASGLHCMSK